MSRIGRKPIEIPTGVTVSVDPGRVQVTGPLGTLQQQVPLRMTDRAGGGQRRRHPADRARRGSRAARPDAHAHRQHGRGRHEGLREAPGDPGRRLPRRAQGHRPRAPGRLLPPGHDQAAHRHHASRFRRRRRSSSRAPTSSRSARPPPRFARFARRSRTRARASATRASTCAGRSASVPSLTVREGRAAPPQARARQGAGLAAAAASRRLPVEPGHRGAARRRRDGQDARGRVLARAEEVVQGRQERAGGRGRQASSPRARRRPASTRASSTAPATSTTDVSRRSPTARARED